MSNEHAAERHAGEQAQAAEAAPRTVGGNAPSMLSAVGANLGGPVLQRKLARRLVQKKGSGQDTADVHAAAEKGMSGSSQTLPHLDRVQASFGRHDVTGIGAHVGGAATAASDSIGASAYAMGNNVAFRDAPDLHTAAHEAAHVVQQRGGVQLKGGVGEAGDPYERHADAVADAVVAGRSAEALLDGHAGPAPGLGGGAVQRQEKPGDDKAAAPKPDTASDVAAEIPGLIMRAFFGGLSDKERDALAERIEKLPDEEFKKLLKDHDLRKLLFSLLGDKAADKVADKMAVDFPVAQIMFHGVDQSKADHQFAAANKIYGRYGMALKPSPVKMLPKELTFQLLGWKVDVNVNQAILGNKEGTVDEKDIDDGGKQTESVLKTLHPGGQMASFWFTDLKEINAGSTLHGQTLAERFDKKYKGREAVFVWDGSNSDTLAHELGHILWGGHHKDKKNLMAAGDDADELKPGQMPKDDQFILDKEQLRAFKLSIYGQIKKAPAKTK